MSQLTPNLHFTLGPVQGFVAQARRTRDLWAGSFLLSYLSGRAIQAVIEAGGTIVLPEVANDPLLTKIRQPAQGDSPRIGTLPNRFQAYAPDPSAAARKAEEAVQSAWQKIAEAVQAAFLPAAALALGQDTTAIWQRQVEGFWQIAWTVGETPDSLDRRKNWRSFIPTAEGGDHCTIMSEWQELSGLVRARDRERQDRFWEAMRRVDGLGVLDLRPDERLCAIALIKRLFPRVAKDAIGWDLDETTNWPSTAYLAAAPWIALAANAQPELASAYASEAIKSYQGGALGERRTRLASLRGLKSGDFPYLDGNAFHSSALENEKLTPLRPEADRRRLANRLNDLYAAVGSPPSSFYALLLMDGDSLGKLLREREDVSVRLARFSAEVEHTVEQFDGVTVYAGGDDVLALMPINHALEAARTLADAYSKAFDGGATISAGLVLAHYRMPLREVLLEAHHLLDDIAKDTRGRGCLAVSVLKGSGKTCEWAMPWEHVGLDSLEVLVAEFREHQHFSSKFLYSLRDLWGMLAESQALDWHPGAMGTWPEKLDPEKLLVADYCMTREATVTPEEAAPIVERLLKVSALGHRSDGEAHLDHARFGVDAALLVRFLAQEIRE